MGLIVRLGFALKLFITIEPPKRAISFFCVPGRNTLSDPQLTQPNCIACTTQCRGATAM